MERATTAIFAALLLALGCEPVATPVAVAAPPAPTAEATPQADTCHRSSPDCAAACALRELDQLEFVDWFDRRCAAVRLGKNADKAVGIEPPPAPAASSAPPSNSDVFSNPYR
jgi:hypothetical protein